MVGTNVGSDAHFRLTALDEPDALFATLDGQLGYAAPHDARTMFVPYFVLDHRRPQAECIACDVPVTLSSLRQAWGFSLVLNPFAVIDID